MRTLAIAVMVFLGGCEASQSPPATSSLDAEITVQRVSRVFAVPRHGAAEHALIADLSAFAGGRMDALHLALPPGTASSRLRERLIVAGVRPRKIRVGNSQQILAERYLATVPPCPGLTVTSAGFGSNTPVRGYGCATLANLAADTSDPADLLGSAATESPETRRSEAPVARFREPAAPK